MSVLSEQSDGMGFHYGFVPGDFRRIDVRQEGADAWGAYVGGEKIATAISKDQAEELAVRYIEANPESHDEEE